MPHLVKNIVTPRRHVRSNRPGISSAVVRLRVGLLFKYGIDMSKALKDKTVLVVDDDADTRELLRFALEQAAANVIEAPSVTAAFETYRQSPPHAVITDIRLGRSDGYALIKAIRETDAEYRGFTPVIAISGFASADDEARAMDSGFNAFIAKPFDPATVVSVITALLKRSNDLAA